MLTELNTLLSSVADPNATYADYAQAIVDENCLGKRTWNTRKLSLQYLTKLYALNPSF